MKQYRTITCINADGASLTVTEKDFSPFLLTGADGIYDSANQVYISENSMTDGAIYQGSVAKYRNIVLRLADVDAYRDNRDILNEIFKEKEKGTLIYQEGDGPARKIGYYVESLTSTGLHSSREHEISLICPDPFFREANDHEEAMAGWASAFQFPFSNPVYQYFEFGYQHKERLKTITNTSAEDGIGLEIIIESTGTATNPRVIRIESAEALEIGSASKPFTMQAGDVVTITTEETTLENRSVTISQGTSSVTKHFDSNLVAEFPSVPFIGEVDIESTNGILTANGTLTIPYFGRYAKKINFWQATLNILGTNETLYGRTITISKDGTTMGTTQFDNTGHATYMVNSPGTYRLSVTSSDGITFTEDVNVTEETAYTVLLGAVDGKTALPTDDIQIWLHCAGIYDKNYTTLSQVLADNTTLLALISSPNAVDYMVRSKTWAGSANTALVPAMTSNTTPSGTVTYYSSGSTVVTESNAYKVFDGNDTTISDSPARGTVSHIRSQVLSK